MAVWPASISKTVTYQETPYKLYKMPKRWGAIAKLLWRVLHKLNALEPFSEKVTKWTYEPAQQDELHEIMLKAINEQPELAYNKKGVFIIGEKTFQELVDAPIFRETMVFHTGPFGRHDPYMGRQMYNVPIHIVPYMEGVALVPKVVIEQVQ